MTLCKPVYDTDEYVCGVCGWGVGKQVTAPFTRRCFGPDYEKLPRKEKPQRRAAIVAKEGGDLPHVFGIARGPGTELHKILAWLGITYTADCPCKSHAGQMDAWGPDGCEENIDTIVGWMEEETKKRTIKRIIATPGGMATVEDTLPFVRAVAKRLVRLAIRRARKKAAHQAGQT